jgi:hypothetical protein
MVEPKVNAVLDDLAVLFRSAQVGSFKGDYAFMPVAGNGAGAAVVHTPANALEQAADDLIVTMTQANATPQAIQAKVEALSAAQAKAIEQLSKDRALLRASLTGRQEAQLVLMGILG